MFSVTIRTKNHTSSQFFQHPRLAFLPQDFRNRAPFFLNMMKIQANKHILPTKTAGTSLFTFTKPSTHHRSVLAISSVSLILQHQHNLNSIRLFQILQKFLATVCMGPLVCSLRSHTQPAVWCQVPRGRLPRRPFWGPPRHCVWRWACVSRGTQYGSTKKNWGIDKRTYVCMVVLERQVYY